MRWTARRKREAIVQHVARCAFCRALLAHSWRRQDRALLAKAEDLAADHATNDAERMAFGRHDEHRRRDGGYCS
jgi:hypothetical protein